MDGDRFDRFARERVEDRPTDVSLWSVGIGILLVTVPTP